MAKKEKNLTKKIPAKGYTPKKKNIAKAIN